MTSLEETWKKLKANGMFQKFSSYSEWSHKDDTPEEEAEFKKTKVKEEHKEDFSRFKSDLSNKELKEFNQMFEG